MFRRHEWTFADGQIEDKASLRHFLKNEASVAGGDGSILIQIHRTADIEQPNRYLQRTQCIGRGQAAIAIAIASGWQQCAGGI